MLKPKQLDHITRTSPLPAEFIAQIFAQQLASGLWEGDDGTERGRLVATTRALADCADCQIDSAHPIYGAKVQRAIRAVCFLSRGSRSGPGMPDEADVSLAIVTAIKTAGDERLRAEAMSALQKSGLARQRKRHEMS